MFTKDMWFHIYSLLILQVRMSTMASHEMIQKALIDTFGDNPDFTLERAAEMKEKMLEDLRDNRSAKGVSINYGRSD